MALTGGIGYRDLRSLILVALGLLLLGAALELAQSALPGRIASLYDVLANTIGIVPGSLFASGANTVWPKHRPTNGRPAAGRRNVDAPDLAPVRNGARERRSPFARIGFCFIRKDLEPPSGSFDRCLVSRQPRCPQVV